MIRFRTLGSLELQRHDGTSITELLTQPKRIALLAYLAIEYHGRTCSREEVMRLLWGEKDRENARNSLNQSLHVLRRALGSDVLITNREEIGINSQQLQCDAALFRSMLDPDLYTGELLPGFFVPNAWAFEDWLDRTRAELREAAAQFPAEVTSASLARTRARNHSRVAVAVVAVAFASAGLIARRSTNDATTIAVLPFAVNAAPELQYLGEGIADLIAAQLDDRGADPHAVGTLAKKKYEARDIAQRVGAKRYITGRIVQVGGHLHIDAWLHDVDGKVLRHTDTGVADPADVFELTDALTADLVAARVPANSSYQGGFAGITPTQAALTAFLEGEANFRAGRYDNAVHAFERAVAADSGFALGYYRLAIAHVWAGGDILTPLQKAERYRKRLPPHQQQLVEAGLAWRSGDNSEAEKLYRAIVDRYPDDVEAWNQLIEIWLHTNAARGRDPAEARYACERVLRLDPQNANALWHLALLTSSGNRSAFDTITRRALTLGPAAHESFELRALRAAVLRDPLEMAQVRRDAEKFDAPFLSAMAERLAVFAEQPQAALDLMQSHVFGNDSNSRVDRAVRSARFEEALGDYAAARRSLAQLQREHFGTYAMERAFLDLLPGQQSDSSELRGAIRDLLRWDAIHDHGSTDEAPYWPALRAYWIARAYTRLHDGAHAQAFIDELAKDTTKAGSSLTQSARAFLAAAQGDSTSALRLIESAYREYWYPEMGESAPQAQAGDRFLRAEMLRATGRNQEAARWYATSERNSLDDVSFLAIARQRRAGSAIRRKEGWGHRVR
jgi:TolB-like protein